MRLAACGSLKKHLAASDQLAPNTTGQGFLTAWQGEWGEARARRPGKAAGRPEARLASERSRGQQAAGRVRPPPELASPTSWLWPRPGQAQGKVNYCLFLTTVSQRDFGSVIHTEKDCAVLWVAFISPQESDTQLLAGQGQESFL